MEAANPQVFKKWRRNVIVGYVLILIGAGYTFGLVEKQQTNQNKFAHELAHIQRQNTAKLEKHLCEQTNTGRLEGNNRAALLKLVVAEVVESQRKAEKTLKGYTPPKQIVQLEKLPVPKALPPVKC